MYGHHSYVHFALVDPKYVRGPQWSNKFAIAKNHPRIIFGIFCINQGLLDLDGRNSQKYLHQTWADF